MRKPVILPAMNKIDFSPRRLLRDLSALRRRTGTMLGSVTVAGDANALLYSAKSFAAAMLAYYIALSIGLEKPSWAIITVYIVSQTSVGASLSRSVYRLAGTIVGAGATVLIVPTFVNTPIFCSVVLTGWITFCLYLSLLERTPRAYAFVLAGYTASLIGFPAVFHPGEIFDTAIVRVQEIGIGIFCAALSHRYVLPKRISGLFNSKIAQTLHSARQMLADALAGSANEAAANLRLALALQFLQGLSHHIPYDFAFSAPVRHARKALHDKLARLLIVSGEIHDRLLMVTALPADIQTLLEEVQSWLVGEDSAKRKITGQALAERSAILTKRLAVAEVLTFETALQMNLVRHLHEAIILLLHCERLANALAQAKPAQLPAEDKPAKGYVFHRDSLSAARTALGAFVIILCGCLIWIYSAWPDGATAVSILGVCCTLFGSFDTPAPHIVKYMIGSAWGGMVSLLYSFALLPQVTDFAVLVAVLAPVYLWAGSLQARPATTFMAMGITLTLPILCELGAHYSGDFATAVNTAIALFAATGFAVLGMGLLQTVQADAAIQRLLRICQRDIRRSVKGVMMLDEVHWTNLMMDRAALLLPRLQRSEQAAGDVLQAMLHALRIGLAVVHLRRLQTQVNRKTAVEISLLLERLIHHTDSPAPGPHLHTLIDHHAPSPHALSQKLTDSLLDLHCALRAHNKEPNDG